MCCGLWTLHLTIQHRAVLIIFPLNLHTISITRMLSSGGERLTTTNKTNKIALVTLYDLFCSCDLDLDPITLICEFDQDVVSRSRLLKVRAQTGQTDRQTDRRDWMHDHAARMLSMTKVELSVCLSVCMAVYLSQSYTRDFSIRHLAPLSVNICSHDTIPRHYINVRLKANE